MDCELVDGGLLAQDLNGWSSLAYVAAGALVVRSVPRHPGRSVLASALLAVGVGSLLHHGAPSGIGGWVHDVSLVALLGFVAGWHVGRLRDRAGATAAATLVTCATLGGLLVAAVPGATNAVVAVLVLLAVAAEVAGAASGLGWLLPKRGALVAGMALGAVAMGRSGSPLCDLGSVLQWHALWHVLSATLALVWARAVLRPSGISSGASAPTAALR